MQDIGFDVIGDLHLSPNDSFNWENKATSLYCIVAGNVSSNLRTIRQTLIHLSGLYQGVFYVPGMLEYSTSESSIPDRIIELIEAVAGIPNVCMLHQHVAVIDGIAIVGVNGWSGAGLGTTFINLFESMARQEDTLYLKNSISKLQRHLDVKKIIVVTNAVPHESLYYNENPYHVEYQTPLCEVLEADTEKKVSHWIFGTYEKTVDVSIDNINYLNNPRPSQSPYWAKRITLSI